MTTCSSINSKVYKIRFVKYNKYPKRKRYFTKEFHDINEIVKFLVDLTRNKNPMMPYLLTTVDLYADLGMKDYRVFAFKYDSYLSIRKKMEDYPRG